MSESALVSNLYTLNYDLGNGRQIQINGNFTYGQTEEQKYASLCAVVDIVERQRARLAIEQLEFRMKQQEKQLADMITHLGELTKKLEAAKGRDKQPNVLAQVQSLTTSKDQLVESIKDGYAEIQRTRVFVETGVREGA